MPTDPAALVRLSASTLAVVLALGPVGLIGCGGSAEAICDEICDCEGCSDDEHAECVDDLEDAERTAENEGCEDQFDEVMSCVDDQLECRSGNIDADGCESEAEDLEDCMDSSVIIGGGSSGSGGSNVCQDAADLCGGGSVPPEQCTGAIECASRCIVDFGSCDQSNAGLTDCVNGCTG